MYKITHYETSSLTTGLYERFDSIAPVDDITTFTAIERYVTRTLRDWHREYVIRRTTACLAKLDDRQLADIGISHDQIPEAARRSVEHPDARDPRAFGKV